MRLARRAAVAAAVLGLVGAAPAQDGPADRETAVVRWALTYAPLDDTLRGRVTELARSDAADADERLFALGEPARRVLLGLVAEDAEVARRRGGLLARMQALENEVERRWLAQDVPVLSVLGEPAAARAARLVPEDGAKDPAAWLADRHGGLRFEPTLDRWTRWRAWERDQAPIRLRNRDKIRLDASQALVSFGRPVTFEAWVRWPRRQQAYLATDEAWPGMSGQVPTDVEAGFALRRNDRGDGTATLELCCGQAPRGWFGVESAPLRITWQWEHVAAVSDGRVLRLFRDGELVAARALGETRLVPGVGDVCVGVRQHAWPDRRAELDVRAVRVSEGARYVRDFVPEQRLAKDAATRVLLDFTPAPTTDGLTTLRDLSGAGRDGHAEGARFVPPLDLADLRVQLASVGAPPGELVLAEAEEGGGTAEWFFGERESRSGGADVEVWSERGPDAAGHTTSVPFTVPRAGRWRVHVVGAGLNRGSAGVSPFTWRVDDGPWRPQLGALPALYGIGGDPEQNLSALGAVELGAGEHVFRLRLVSPRTHQDRRWSLWLDALVLEELRP